MSQGSGKSRGKRRRLKLRYWLLAAVVVLMLCFLPTMAHIIYPMPYLEEIQSQCQANRADAPLVMAVIYSESRFRPKAESSVGARGLMQIMPETGTWIAGHMGIEDFDPDQLFEPELNISMGIWYIGWLEKQFANNPIQVLAAYNAGPGNVKSWLIEGQWDGTMENIDQIPFNETRNYVGRVLKQLKTYRKLYENR